MIRRRPRPRLHCRADRSLGQCSLGRLGRCRGPALSVEAATCANWPRPQKAARARPSMVMCHDRARDRVDLACVAHVRYARGSQGRRADHVPPRRRGDGKAGCTRRHLGKVDGCRRKKSAACAWATPRPHRQMVQPHQTRQRYRGRSACGSWRPLGSGEMLQEGSRGQPQLPRMCRRRTERNRRCKAPRLHLPEFQRGTQ